MLGLGFSLDPVIQADTPINQCCNFSRYSLAFETVRDMYIEVSSALNKVVYVKTRDNNAEWCSVQSSVIYYITKIILKIQIYFNSNQSVWRVFTKY